MTFDKTRWGGRDRLGNIEDALSNGVGVAELAYVEFTADVSVTATSESSPTDIVSAGQVTFDGNTRICVEFYSAAVTTPTAQSIILNLWEDTTALGRIAVVQGESGAGGPAAVVVLARRYYTPTAGTKTLKIRGWVTSGTGTVGSGAGGTTTRFPGYIRVSSGG